MLTQKLKSVSRRDLLRLIGEKTAPSEEEASNRRERGVLFGSGLVGGEGLLGVLVAAVAVSAQVAAERGASWAPLAMRIKEGIGPEWAGSMGSWLSALAFAGLIFYFWTLIRRRDT